MNTRHAQPVFFSLLAAWVWFCLPNWQEQLQVVQQAPAQLRGISWEDRAGLEWPAGYQAVRDIAAAVPAGACVVILARTTPEKRQYYQARFPYYLYPRRLRFAEPADAAFEGCGYLAVFRDEPAAPHWDEEAIARRTASMTRVLAGSRAEIFR